MGEPQVNQDVMQFLIKLEQHGYSYYLFFRCKENHHVLDIRGNGHSFHLIGSDLQSIVDTYKNMIEFNQEKVVESIDSFL